ncbi:MAG: TonB-dependent receptor, partial [Caulobacterales bacterium]|nr:TonB-dependent receptor [Caulobacterales bacterium]
NAGGATSWGFELDTFFNVTDNFVLGGNFAYTNTEFNEYVGPCPVSGTRFGPLEPLDNGFCSFEGFPLPYAPEYKGSVYGEYTAPGAIAGWDLTGRGAVSFSDDYDTIVTFNPGEFQEAYETIDAQLRLSSPDGRYTWSVIGRNLTEEAILDWALVVGGGQSYLAGAKPPRDISIQFQANF